jgi:hypothetical protein
VQAQKLEPRSDCTYQIETTVINNKTVITRQTEKCVEEPGIEIPKLKIGDVVRSNQLLRHPVIDIDFYYKQTKCRWFAQTHTVQKDLVQFQGIACEVQSNVWRIVDKF